MSDLVDIFGIETDYAIDLKAKEMKRIAHEKRKKIIDADILTYLHCYAMLDKMALQPTKAKKKQFIIDYLMWEIPYVRQGADSKGKYKFAYCEEYKGKAVDREMCSKMADYILSTYAHEDGVRFHKIELRDDSFKYLDKNGVEVIKARFDNGKIISEYEEKYILDHYPFENKKNKKYYSSDGKHIWTQYLTDEENDIALEQARNDSRYVHLVDVD